MWGSVITSKALTIWSVNVRKVKYHQNYAQMNQRALACKEDQKCMQKKRNKQTASGQSEYI